MTAQSRRSPRKAVNEAYFAEMSIPEPNSGCWLWLGTMSNRGYGAVRMDGGLRTSAQRASYIVHVGPVDDNLDIDHLCRNPACVNPQHLEAVTHLENCRRRSAVRLTCKSGHPLNGFVRRSSGVCFRFCKTCANQQRNARNALARAARAALTGAAS